MEQNHPNKLEILRNVDVKLTYFSNNKNVPNNTENNAAKESYKCSVCDQYKIEQDFISLKSTDTRKKSLLSIENVEIPHKSFIEAESPKKQIAHIQNDKISTCDFCSILTDFDKNHTFNRPRSIFKSIVHEGLNNENKENEDFEESENLMDSIEYSENEEQLNESDYVQEGKQKYECEICGKILSSQKGLNVHFSLAHENYDNFSDNNCKMCHKTFTSGYNLKRHIFTVHKSAQNALNVPFSIVHQNENHSEISENNCEICQKTFSSFSNLNRHITIVHKSEQKVRQKVPIHKCDLCGKSFNLPQKLQSHMSSVHYGNKGMY